MKREAAFTIYFRHWLKTQNMPSGAFELKQTTTTSLPYSAIQEHQINALLACKEGRGLLWKLPDDSRGVKPFDMFYLARACAWIVIRYPNSFHMIDIDTFLLEKDRSKRKSLTEERARQIATHSIKTKKA